MYIEPGLHEGHFSYRGVGRSDDKPPPGKVMMVSNPFRQLFRSGQCRDAAYAVFVHRQMKAEESDAVMVVLEYCRCDGLESGAADVTYLSDLAVVIFNLYAGYERSFTYLDRAKGGGTSPGRDGDLTEYETDRPNREGSLLVLEPL